jgi:hypothetical protein
MGDLLDAIFGWIKAVWDKIWEFIKENWLIILLIVVIWYAPQIAAWLESSGAPAFLVDSFSWIGSAVTPTLHLIGGYVTSALSAIGEATWGFLTSESIGWAVKALVVLGGAYLIAPEEAAAIIDAATEFATDVVVDVVSAIASGVSDAIGLPALAMGGIALYFFFSGRKKDKQQKALEGAL